MIKDEQQNNTKVDKETKEDLKQPKMVEMSFMNALKETKRK